MVRQWAILTIVAALGTGAAHAQSARGTVQGRVIDATGAVIAGATVAVINDATGFRTETQSDTDGRYRVASLDPATYRLDVSQAGFRRAVQSFTVRVGQELLIDVPLETGPVAETVTVTAANAGLERVGTALVTRFDPATIANLPLDGRNFLDLALLTAGSAPPAQGSAGSVRGDFTFNVNGGREDANAYVLDGAYNFDPKLNTVGVRPPVDGIREFAVVTSTPDASYGKNAAAQISIVTQSGTNRLRATAYEFLRTGLFGARNFFAPENEDAPDYVRHQYGGSIGGAIKPDRLFFFADYEGMRLDEGITRVTTVPTLAERVGDFSASAFPKPLNPQTGQPFPNDQIPTGMLNQIGLAIAGLYPRPNREGPTGNFVSSPSQIDNVDQFDVRVDYVGQNYRIMSRYSFSDRRLFEPFAGLQFAAVPGFGNDVPRNAQNFVVSDTRTLGTRYVNEARFSYSRIAQSVLHEGRDDDLNSQVGLPNLSPNERDWGLSFITVASYSSLGDEYNNPQDSTANLWQLSDTLSWTQDRHVLKAGVEFRGVGQDAFRDVQSRGLLQFTNVAFTHNALADLLIGLPTVTVGAAVDNPQRLRTHSFAMFLQDSYQFSPTVAFNAGLRYEYNAPPVDADDRVTLYDPETGTIVPVGTGGMPRAGYDADRNNFAPRLGAAWSVRPDTVVRTGYGIAYDQSALAPNEFLYFNTPYYDLNTYFSVPQANYFLTLDDPFPANFPIPLPESATAVQRDLRTAYLHQWNVNVQHQLDDYRTIEVAWVASRGRNLLTARDLNQPEPSPDIPNPRPNPAFADITFLESRGRSSYDALQVRMDQRLYRAVAFSGAYTLGNSMDDASGFFPSAGDANFPQDSNNPDAEWSRSNFDVRHRFTLTGLYEIPFGANRRWDRDGVVATILGNWDVHGILTLQSGAPFTVAIHPDIDNSNTGRANLGFGSNDRPNQVGDPTAVDQSERQWFDTAAFVFPPFGTFGDVGRNSLEGPGYKNLNLAFSRNVALAPGTLQIRLEFFNLFNWTNLGLPDNFLGSPTFGQILSAGAPRRFQIGVRFLY
ncbi:MAG TPA: carboxypeptidase regulatory-like domain-containing protein [Vicinamibacterales bacterium]|nr:carboxypeptidase regulatory-like domain-containing protein [Vicinamibacterales bacterium]